MGKASQLSTSWLTRFGRKASFILILALLVRITLAHYGEAFEHPVFLTEAMFNLGLDRHTFDRILYLAPVVWAGFVFGSRLAIITSLAALACMLPRAILISPYPKDALFETSAVFIIGIVLAISFGALRKEREHRAHLAALDQVSTAVSRSLELSQILNSSLASVLNVMRADAALVFLLDGQTGELTLTAYQGVSSAFAQDVGRLKLGEGFIGRVAESGELLFVKDASQTPALTRELGNQHKMRSALIVPMSPKGTCKGSLCVAMRSHREFHQNEVELLSAIGNQIGVAVENVHLYEQLQESEEKYRVIFETTGTATVIIEENTTIALANGEFEKLSGYSKEEIEGKKSWTEFIAKDDLERMREFHHLRRVEPKTAPSNYEFQFLDTRGNVRDIFLTVAMVLGTQRSVASLLDITERKQAEEKIRVSEKRYRELFENAHDAIWLHDLKENMIEANKSFFKLTGYTPEELTSIKASDLIADGCVESVRNAEASFLKDEAIGHLSEATLVKKDKSTAFVQLSTSPVFSNRQVVGVQHIARDITEQKRTHENLRFYLEQATRAQEEERKRISHELHDETVQALVVLSQQLDTLASSAKGLSQDDRLHFEELRQRTNNIMQAVRRLSQDLLPPALDHLGLLPALEWLASDVAKYSGITTKVEVLGTERRFPEEVELVLFRITQEALRNVWRHAKATQAEVIVEFKQSKTKITIRDNGKGFNPPRTIGDLVREGKLGLAGMQERAQLIGGTISVQSQPNRGAKIVMELPV